jgi:mannosylglycerate hydrolase
VHNHEMNTGKPKTQHSVTDNAAVDRYDMHLILNTHWDREYRWSFRETQMRLMEAGDILVSTMEKDPRFKYFHPDSQTSFLDDYLEFRPENRERVKKLVSEGRILAGPWYTLPAEYLVSGEALVRNLLMGHRIAKDLGGVMKCAYNIFSWGQVSQLPQIYRQFGMDTILFYRGIDQSHLDKLEFWWEAPDGSRAMGLTFGSFHRLNFWIYVYNPYLRGGKGCSSLPTGEYDLDAIQKNGGMIAKLGDDYSTDDLNYHVMRQPVMKSLDAALAGMETLRDTVKDKASTRHLLFLQGFDQENPDPIIPDLVEQINARIDYGKLRISSLPEYVKLVREEMAAKGLDKGLVEFKGEMLSVETSGDAFAPLYNGVFSARMPLKLKNADCQYRLERWAEPTSVWQLLLGKVYPAAVLRSAWKELLQNQQHDGIGGCHVDRIQLAMEERYRITNDISECVTRDNLKALVAEIDFSNVGEHELGLTVFNTSAQPRREVMEVTVDIPRAWGLRDYGPYKKPLTVEVFDADGQAVRSQVIGVEDDTLYAYLKYGNAINIEASRLRIAITAEVPAIGYAFYRILPKQAASRPVDNLSPQTNVLENALLRAEIQGDGTVRLLNKKTGRVFENLNYFEDEGECGGPLAHSKPNGDATYTTLGHSANVALVTNGPLVSTYRIEREWALPEGLDEERKIHVPHGSEWVDYGALKRSLRKALLKVVTEITLRRDSGRLEFVTTVENSIANHRLRVCFPSGLAKATKAHVDSPFDVVARPIAIPDSSGWYEAAARTQPTTSFVDVNDGDAGLAVLHVGLSEYEVIDDPSRTIAFTLLRCFGNAGNPTETHVNQPLAQCPGKHTFRYAVQPHVGDWRAGKVLGEAGLYTSRLRAVVCTAHTGTLPRRHSFFSIEPEAFVVTAVKQSEVGDGIVVRGYNPTPEAMTVALRLPEGVTRAIQVTLEEIPVGELPVIAGKVAVSARAGEIVSILMPVRCP